MVGQRVIGSRIRERRLDQGMRQADVAQAANISPSYLNLIEHNKRRIGGKLLATLAGVLDIDAATLASGADAAVLDGMRAAVARLAEPVEVERAEDLAARYPGWAGLIAAQEVRLDALENEVRTLSDRIAHDPALAGALHNVITAVTSIRATAGILVSDDRIDADWQRRFHVNIHDDSRRLAHESKSLVSYLDQPAEPYDDRGALSVFDQAETFLATTPQLLALIEDRPTSPVHDIFANFEETGLSRDAQFLVLRRLEQFAADAEKLPKKKFHTAAIQENGDPAVLAAQFDTDLPTIFRRLAYLPDELGLAPMGLAVCDAAGALTILKAIPGFGLNRRSFGCPLWPLYAALNQPQRAVKCEVVLPDPGETRFLCFATAVADDPRGFDAPSLMQSTMLVVADPEPRGVPAIPVGTNCRICPRNQCAARREPSVIEGFL